LLQLDQKLQIFVKKIEGILGIKILGDLWACYQLMPRQQNLPKFAQHFPKLPKSVPRQNFEIPPKIEILVFLKNKIK
jgi:hypothetical protein